MKRKYKKIDLFSIVNTTIMLLLALSCLTPVLNVFAISLSEQSAVASGKVGLWPVDFTLAAYEYVIKDAAFFKSMLISLARVLIGPVLNLLLAVLCAYPLSKPEKRFRARRVYVWLFYFTTLFGGGIIPTYVIINKVGLINSFWSMIIPGAVPVAYIIMMMNFFRNLPKELEEAALVDGASQWTILLKIYIPLSKASIATILLFCIINHWNSWFDGMLYFNNTSGQPMATYLHNIVVKTTLESMKAMDVETLKQMMKISTQTTQAAQIFLAMLPILVVYPFMRRYFAEGVVMGSVKG